MAYKRAQKRHLYPTCLCYHGCVASRPNALTFREVAGDIKSHVKSLLAAGYRIVVPSVYRAWLKGEVVYEGPVTSLHFDDCLGSIDMIIPWLIENNIPCGIAIITRRLGKRDPENGFAKWENVRDWVATGLVEVMSHTHNMHHLTLRQLADLTVDVGPVLEGPCWIDDGDVVYREASDPRWYWDFSHVDSITLGLPLFGTDPYDGVTPIVTTVSMTPKVTGSITLLRLWMALSKPSGSGYAAQVQIRVDGVLVWDGVITPKNYETRSQWVEREFYTITLDTPFAVTAGTKFDMEFRTLNAGTGVALLYGLASERDSEFSSVTNCRGLYPEGSQGWPNKYWQYTDYPAGDRWTIIPCLILGFGTGRQATEAEYLGYVATDCTQHNQAVSTWLGAQWGETQLWTPVIKDRKDGTWTGPITEIMYIPVGWANPNRTVAVIPLTSGTTRAIDYFRIKVRAPEVYPGGDADPFGPGHRSPGGSPGESPILSRLDEASTRSYPATFQLDISDTPSGPWTHIGTAAIWRLARIEAADVDTFTLTAGVTKYLRITPINAGPTVGMDQRCRWPIAAVYGGFRTSTEVSVLSDQIVYPFGSYLEDGVGVTQQNAFKDIAPSLKATFISAGLDTGYTIQSYRNIKYSELREQDLRQTNWALGRWLVYGTQATDVSLNNLQALSGYLLPDVQHRGVEWQVSLEADTIGNATIKSRADVMDYVAFDAWAFNGQALIGTPQIVPFPCNNGGTYGGVVYPNDKAYLQSRGVKCLLIVNNNLGTGEPDVDIAWDVIWHPEIWVPMLVQTAINGGWDGITCNIEAVPAASRAQAIEFYKQFGRGMHAAGLLAHITAPAPTGTNYDAAWWVGWCDHGEIVKYVDAVKVMSYTETGPGSNPGPAAPDWFWEAVYNRIRAIVPVMYWPRILCGARAFGHLWDRSNLAGAEYVSYHRGIAEALQFGARLDLGSTELGWGNSNFACWFGTPLTVDRSQKEAADAGFGGLGLWKLDDGDIEEFFPTHRTIGRYEEMSYLNARFPTAISFGSSGGPSFNTSSNRTQSGEESRQSLWLMPLYEYDASLRIRTQAEYEEVRDLFMVARGEARTFRYKDWMDFQLAAVLIGVGDGSVVNFQCVKAYAAGGETMVRTITKLVEGTISIMKNGVVDATAVVSYHTGVITFLVPPAVGVEVTISGEFDVHVRFGSDRFPAEIVSWGEGAYLSPGTVPLREVRKA